MSPPCPAPREFARLSDGELTENRAAQVRAHAAGCAACGAELGAQQRLLDGLRAPVPGLPADGALAAIMGRLDGADAAAGQAARRAERRPWASLAFAAAAAAILLGVTTAPVRRDDAFAPRGGAVALDRRVGVELWALGGSPHLLAPGDRLAAGVPVVASFSSADPLPAYLLAFAVDARGEVHWLYPGWLDAAQDPPAVRLEGPAARRALQESVVLEGVAGGPLRLVTVVTRAPRRVSEIEAVAPGERTVEALRRRWPDARVEELAVRYDPASPAAPRGLP